MTGPAPSVSVIAERQPDVFATVDQRAEELRRKRAAKIKDAVQRRDKAQADLDATKQAEKEARQRLETANGDLRGLIEKGERVVIQNSLVTINEHGGLQVEPVTVLGLL